MKSLFVAGYHGKGAGSSFIKKFTDRPYSHVSFVLLNGRTLTEYESIQFKGVVKHPWTRREDVDLFEVIASQDQIDRIIAEAEALVGSKYDWKAIWGFIIRADRDNPKKVICSEYVPLCCQAGGIMLQRMRHHKQTPGIVCASPIIIPFAIPKSWAKAHI